VFSLGRAFQFSRIAGSDGSLSGLETQGALFFSVIRLASIL
jgi:hypothetical protein